MARTYVFNSGENEPNPKELDLTFGVFFDGTGNNLRNTEIRKKVQGVEGYGNPSSDEEKIYKKKALKFFSRKEKNNSYKNDFSNVARLNLCTDEAYTIYIEGIGTEDEKGDSVFPGQALGTGATGVLMKVRKGCQQTAYKTSIKLKDNEEEITSITLTLDVYGFSRGAAAARNFIYEVQKKSYKPKLKNVGRETFIADDFGEIVTESELIDGNLPPNGCLGLMLKRNGVNNELLKNLQVCIRFVGLYDTVAAYGIKHSNDTKQLNLNDLGSPRKVIHFTAADENRKKFSLTKIPFGTEKVLPGVHSDIGGGYDNLNEAEERLLGKSQYDKEPLIKLRKDYINQGWYKETEVVINSPSPFSTEKKLIGTRNNIKKEYSYLVLHYMEHLAKDHLINNEIIITTKRKYPIGNHPILLAAKKRLNTYMKDAGKEWTLRDDDIEHKATLKKLRNKYLHRSSNIGSFVNSPTKSGERTAY